MANQDMQRVVTGKVRLSFVHLFTPRANPNNGGAPKFSATLLIPKQDAGTKQRLDAAINAAVQEGVTSKWGGQRPPVLSFPIHDGDGVKPSDGMPFGDECKGHWVLTASSQADRKPEIVDLNMNPIINQSEMYSGVYAKVSIRFFAYASNGKKGIGCGLGNVQKVEDGSPLSGGTSASTDFGGGDSYAPPAQGYQQQPVYQQQPQYQQQPAQPWTSQPPLAPNQYPPQQQPMYQQPPQQPNYAPQPQQQPMGYPQQQVQIDPITGKPLVGNIMGI